MEDQIQKLVSQIHEIKSSTQRTRYPEEVKRSVIELYQHSGQKRMALLRTLGLNHNTVALWLKSDSRSVRATEPVFKAVSVDKAPALLPKLVLSNGILVENLSEELLMKVLSHALSAR